MNFKNYINKLNSFLLFENINCKELIDNFTKLFKNSTKILPILNLKTKEIQDKNNINNNEEEENNKKEYNILIAECDIKHEVKNDPNIRVNPNTINSIYHVTVEIKRNDTNKPYSISDDCKVYCTCNAFRYNVAYPDLNKNGFYGIPKSNNKIPNKILNPNKIPTICKHCYSLLAELTKKGIIRNS